MLIREHLLGEPGRRRMRDRVVGVHEIELLALGDFVLFDRERERIRRRLLEQRVFELRDFVERHALRKAAQPKRTRVRDEVDVVPAPRELEAELRSDGTRPSVRGIARNPDSHLGVGSLESGVRDDHRS